MLTRLKIKSNLLNLNLKRQTSSFQFRATIAEWKFLLTVASWQASYTVPRIKLFSPSDTASVDWRNAEFKIYIFLFRKSVFRFFRSTVLDTLKVKCSFFFYFQYDIYFFLHSPRHLSGWSPYGCRSALTEIDLFVLTSWQKILHAKRDQ